MVILAGAALCQTIPWPYYPTNQAHPIGNNYMEYQNYGGAPYYHDGIDLMAGYGGRRVYSSNTGVVNHISQGTMYGGIMIGQAIAGGEGWLYWHIPSSTMQFAVGDSVYTGEYFGDVATWSVYNFHHVHFNQVVGESGYPWGWYHSTDNPLNYLDPITDNDAPFFENAVPNGKFAFATNNTTTYLNPNNLSGQIDIIAHIADIIGDPDWDENPFEIWYWIDGPVSTNPVCSFIASGWCPEDNTVNVPYQDDNTCNTQGDYTAREYYFSLTNSDGDSTVELSDENLCWNTTLFPNGNYWIFAIAKDRFGNSTADSMLVTLTGGGGTNLEITMTPAVTPIVIPPGGGSFNYTVEIANNGTGTVIFDAWIMATLPGGNEYGPIVIRSGMSLAPGASVLRNMTQYIPSQAPAGQYYFYGTVGIYPGIVIDEDGFNFTKQN